MPISLESILMDPPEAPPRLLIHGVQGAGKTTLAATFPNPILLPTEDGARGIRNPATKAKIPQFPLLTSFEAVLEALESLYNDETPFETVVLDSLDWLEPLIWDYTCLQNNVDNIEQVGGGFGKGYTEALLHWRTVFGWLDALRDYRGMTVVCIAHTAVKRFEPPDGDSYDRYQIKLQDGKSTSAANLACEWADGVFFVNFLSRVSKEAKGFGKERARVTGRGDRVVYTDRRPAFEAKARASLGNLPPEIIIGTDKEWKPFHSAFAAAQE